jgi:leucyl aminopeptidase
MIASISIRSTRSAVREDALVLPVYSGARRLPAASARLDRAHTGAGALLAADPAFKGKRGETRTASVKRGGRLIHVVVVGLGPAGSANPEEIADAAGAAGRALAALRTRSAAIAVDDACQAGTLSAPSVAGALVKGVSLALYSYSVAPRPAPPLRRLVLVCDAPARELNAAVRRARLLVDMIVRVRDWVNTPGNQLGTVRFAEQACALLKSHRVECRAWGRREIARAGMGGVLAVAEGSRQEPRLVVAHHRLDERRLPLVCLVGKGVTFDSGGISIKPWEKMHEMKSDMAGGASVVAAIAAAADLELPIRVVGLVPCVENMPGGAAFRPGDVLTLYSGKTVEVLTTDAEGRLILADAVAYARAHYRPDVIVDMATLTGGVVVALGTRMAGMMGTSPRDLDSLEEAGARAGEPVWPLPMDDYFLASVKGEISDYKNYAGRGGSPITGGALIGAFAEGTPWVHVDIAGTSWNEGTGPSYQTPGATGYGVDLLVSFLEIVASRGRDARSSATPPVPGGSRRPRNPSPPPR